MLRKSLTCSAVLGLILAIGMGLVVHTQDTEIPAIPGITAEDTHPNGCVDCHRTTEDGRDYRLSTAIAEWASTGVPETVLERAKAAWPEAFLEGKHPAVSRFVANRSLPQACVNCHKPESGLPLKRLIHTLHYAGGGENHFVSSYDGRCLQCHKMNADITFPYPPTGEIGIKSGTEQSSHDTDANE
ncbi:MAG: hypothetical protein ABEK03_05415 [Candidatus Bipolaricaulia bacterium]